MNPELVLHMRIIRVPVYIIVILYHKCRHLEVKSKQQIQVIEILKVPKIEIEIYQPQKRHNQHHKRMQMLIEQ